MTKALLFLFSVLSWCAVADEDLVEFVELDSDYESNAGDQPLFEDEDVESEFKEDGQDELNQESSGEEELLEEGDELFLDDSMELELSDETGRSSPPRASGIEFAGRALIDYKYFPHNGTERGQEYHHNISFAVEPEWSYQWDNGNQSLVFVPYFMGDQHDSARTHFDIRELLWAKRQGNWDFRVGIGKVFWGVAESVHVVDIINQTDLVVNLDTEDKLGQPMINAAYTSELGTVEAFVLPGFRKRTFPGREGRIRQQLILAQHDPIYESGAGAKHVDFAARWSHAIGDWDIGLAHFHGTSREPRFVPVILNPNQPPAKVRPLYEIIDQTSIDIQAVKGSWLWKLETYNRNGQAKNFQALAAGFEYTFSGVYESGADLGLLLEFLHDNREDNDLLSPFQNDIFFGFRLALNDQQSTEVLAGFVKDIEHSSVFYNVEASRRLGDKWKLNIESRIFSHLDRGERLLFGFRNESYVMLELERYF